MKTIRRVSIMILSASCVIGGAVAQELMVYPKDGQSAEQQEKDKFECYGWAKTESGFDPMAPPTATSAPPQQDSRRGGAGRGLMRGAAVGAIVDGGEGAKKGAAAGALIGGMRRRDQNRQQQNAQDQWQQEQQQIYAEKRSRYNRAYSACLQGRGYTVT